jgi:N-acetylmuramoyl-L-alanine amidase CwlA
LTAWLTCKYNLKEEDIIRHYDVTGKLCPLYFVKHEDEWIKFKDTVMEYIKENATEE